jgi:diguanylate cyclase (GGDEF)-like protein
LCTPLTFVFKPFKPTLKSLLVTSFDPDSVLITGAAICLSLAVVLYIQSRYLKDFNDSLTRLVGCLLTATVAMVLALHENSSTSTLSIVSSNTFCTLSYCLAMLCAISLYQPERSRSNAYFLIVIALLGASVFHDLRENYLWNQSSRIAVMAYASWVIFHSKDEEAPELQRFALGLGLVSSFGMLPTWFAVYNLPVGSVVRLVDSSSDAFKFQALLWAISPALVYACVTSVAYSRIASRFRLSAYTDELTGAHNRRFLFERGERFLFNVRTKPKSEQTSLLLIDIDHFKQVNDTWGHATGDDILKHCVKCIRGVVRVKDSILSRYGGEEFCLLLPSTSQNVAALIAERVRLTVASTPFFKDGVQLNITISIGVAESSELTTAQFGLKRLLSFADKRLYLAKKSGRNLVMSA